MTHDFSIQADGKSSASREKPKLSPALNMSEFEAETIVLSDRGLKKNQPSATSRGLPCHSGDSVVTDQQAHPSKILPADLNVGYHGECVRPTQKTHQLNSASETPVLSGGPSIGHWTPLPWSEALHFSTDRSPIYHPFQMSVNRAGRGTPDAGTPARTTSKSHDSVSIPPPPALQSSTSSTYFPLMARPMIMSPTPTCFLIPNRSSERLVRHQTTHRTPLDKSSFNPTIFSVHSALSDPDNPRSALRSKEFAFQSQTRAGPCSSIDGVRDIALVSIEIKDAITKGDFLSNQCKPSPSGFEFNSLDSESWVATNPMNKPCILGEKRSIGTRDSTAERAADYAERQLKREPAAIIYPPAAIKRVPHSDDSHASDIDIDGVMCNCSRSRCLKLYCVCFQRGVLCARDCLCTGCKNTKRESGVTGARTKAIESINMRRADAFGKRVKLAGQGCRCKRNKCLKKYCSCFTEGRACSRGKCFCIDCQNRSTRTVSTGGSVTTPSSMSRHSHVAI